MSTHAKQLGYIHIPESQNGQTTEQQKLELSKLGISNEAIYIDAHTAQVANKLALIKLKAVLADGDTVVVVDLDHLGHSAKEILEFWQSMTELKVKIRALEFSDLDTTDPIVSSHLQSFFGYLALKEKRAVQARIVAGMDKARASGKHVGKRYGFTKQQGVEIEGYLEAKISMWKISKIMGLPYGMIQRLKKRWVAGERVKDVDNTRFKIEDTGGDSK